MEQKEFFSTLAYKLTERGVPEQVAVRHAGQLMRTLTEDEAAEIEAVQSEDELDGVADVMAPFLLNRLARRASTRPDADVRPEADTDTGAQPDIGMRADINMRPDGARTASGDISRADSRSMRRLTTPPAAPDAREAELRAFAEVDASDDSLPPPAWEAPAERPKRTGTAPMPRPVPKSYTAEDGYAAEPNDDFDDGVYEEDMTVDEEEYFEPLTPATPTGRTVFIVGTIVTLPVTLGFSLAVIALFVAVFAMLCGAIIASVAALIAGVTAGGALSLIGIIYGITQIITGQGPVGAYEIGIGIVIAGVVMFAGILIYNFSIRFLPFVIKKVASLVGVCVKQAKKLVYLAKKECYKL